MDKYALRQLGNALDTVSNLVDDLKDAYMEAEMMIEELTKERDDLQDEVTMLGKQLDER